MKGTKKLKRLLPLIIICAVLTVSVAYGLWIIVSEQIRGYIQAVTDLTFEPSGTYYAGESWEYGGASTPSGAVKLTYTDGKGEEKSETLEGKITIAKEARSGTGENISARPAVYFEPASGLVRWVWNSENIKLTLDKDMTLKAVAKYGNNYYSTIDGALTAANSANTSRVTVLTSTDSRAKQAKTIDSTEIKSGVELLIPYDNSITDSYKYGDSSTIQCTNLAWFSKNLKNYGKITVSAYVSGDQKNGEGGAMGERGVGFSTVKGAYAHLQASNDTASITNMTSSARTTTSTPT